MYGDKHLYGLSHPKTHQHCLQKMPISLWLTAAGFKNDSAPTSNNLVHYPNLHGITLGPSVRGKSNLSTTAEELVPPGLPIFPFSARQLIPACPNGVPFPFCCHPAPVLHWDAGPWTLEEKSQLACCPPAAGLLQTKQLNSNSPK